MASLLVAVGKKMARVSQQFQPQPKTEFAPKYETSEASAAAAVAEPCRNDGVDFGLSIGGIQGETDVLLTF